MSGWTHDQIAGRIANDLPEGAVVNLGIGLPEKVADAVSRSREIILHSENGILGMGPTPPEGSEDMELINAGKKPVTLLSGGAFFHHADSFAMIRGGHIDVCVLGAYQVACNGDLANWSTGKNGAPAVGGAMDLAAGAKAVWIITNHTTRDGESKLTSRLTLPATGIGVVERVYTNLGVFSPVGEGYGVIELAEECDLEYVEMLTGAPLFS